MRKYKTFPSREYPIGSGAESKAYSTGRKKVVEVVSYAHDGIHKLIVAAFLNEYFQEKGLGRYLYNARIDPESGRVSMYVKQLETEKFLQFWQSMSYDEQYTWMRKTEDENLLLFKIEKELEQWGLSVHRFDIHGGNWGYYREYLIPFDPIYNARGTLDLIVKHGTKQDVYEAICEHYGIHCAVEYVPSFFA